MKNWQFLTKNLHFSERQIHFLDNFWEIPLIFNFCTKKWHSTSKIWAILTIFWKIWNLLTKNWHFLEPIIHYFGQFFERFPRNSFRSPINHILTVLKPKFIWFAAFRRKMTDFGLILSIFWHKFKTPLGRPSDMANLETVDVRKSRFWRKSWSQIFLVSVVPWTAQFLYTTSVEVRLKARTHRNQKNLRPTFSFVKICFFEHQLSLN